MRKGYIFVSCSTLIMFRLLEKWSQNERQVFLKNIRIHGTVIKNKRYVNRSKTQLTAGFPLESKEKCEKVFSIEEILKFYQKDGENYIGK